MLPSVTLDTMQNLRRYKQRKAPYCPPLNLRGGSGRKGGGLPCTHPPVSHRPATPGVQGGGGLRGTENLRWVACASCFELVGCCAGFALRFGPLTAVADLVQELRRKTMKKRGAKGRI